MADFPVCTVNKLYVLSVGHHYIVYVGDSCPELKNWVAESINSKNHKGTYVCILSGKKFWWENILQNSVH